MVLGRQAFASDEAPTRPSGPRLRVAFAVEEAFRDVYATDAGEMPTTLRPSPVPPRPSSLGRPLGRPRSRPPPLPPPLPLPPAVRARAPIQSLASILEPNPLLRSRRALVPPDPDSFRRRAPERARMWPRWVVRIGLLGIVLAGELALGDPSGALRPPRDLPDAGHVLSSAIRASAAHALSAPGR